MENFGLNTREWTVLHEIFRQYPEIRTVFIFGSRAHGKWKTGSDIDLAIMNQVSDETLQQLRSDFEESNLPYFVDILDYTKLKNELLMEHIDREGQLFYAFTDS